ncbi:hypothetical protein [Niveibacterium sp. SC-1]|uniref:hypothetical protein n=1 Tax=Niveibacterium sp. SC-1 TaxID=3135646 RepID=UPI00311E5D27
MSTAFRELERIESRVLGAVRPVDAVTGTPLAQPLTVSAEGTRILRNLSGLYVLLAAPGLAAHEASFSAPPPTPAVGSVALTLSLSDPSGAYLPRLATIALPREADPAQAANASSLFRPIPVPMLPSPSAALATNWAVLRLSIAANNGDLLGGALVRVLRNNQVLARGLSDWRGEALVPVAGVPVTTFSEDENAVVITQIDVSLQVIFDPAQGTRTPPAVVAQGRRALRIPLVDPDVLESAANLPTTNQALAIAARRTQSLSVVVTLP